MHPDDRAQAEQTVGEAARSGTELNVEFRVRDRDGKERWLLSRGRPLWDGEVPSTDPDSCISELLVIPLVRYGCLSEGDIMSKQLMLLNRLAKTTRLFAVVTMWLCCPANANAQIRLCGWAASGSLPPRHQSNKIVEWGSLADDAGPDLLNISNYVINVDPSGARNIDWEAGSMRVDALRPDNIAYLCQGNAFGRIDRDGPLYFARDRSSISTFVYAGRLATPREFVAGTPLKLDSEFILAGDASKGAKATTIRVRVSTTLLKTGKGYLITYTLTNLSPSDVVVDLPIDPAALKELGDGRLVLKKDETRNATATSDQFPLDVRLPVRIQELSPKGTSAIVLVPTFRTPPRLTGR